MKNNLNFLIIFALLAALAGGSVSPAKAAGELSIVTTSVSPEPSFAGFPIVEVIAKFQSAGSNFTCTVNYGDGSVDQSGIVGPDKEVGKLRCTYPAHIYTAVGTYTVTFTVTDNTDPVNPLVASDAIDHTVVTPYANTVLSTSGTVTDAANALGAQDGSNATFGTAGGSINLGMETLVEDAVLTLYHTTTGPSCLVTALFPSSSDIISIGSTARGATSTVYSLPPYFLNLTITCPAVKRGATLGLDAVQVTPYTETTRYGVAIMPPGSFPTNPTAGLGAPDGKYAVFATGQSMGVVLKVQTVQDGRLTLYHAKGSPVCNVAVADFSEPLWWYLGTTMSDASSSVYNIPEPINTVRVDCGSLGAKEVFSLDAVKFEPVTVPDGYAKHAFVYENINLPPANMFAAVWAPDGQYAQFDPGGGVFILDMGAPVHGTLTFYHAASSTACRFSASPVVEFSVENATLWGSITPGATTSTFTTPNDFQYVAVLCESSFGLDAVMVDPATPAKWYAAMPYGGNEAGINATGAPDGQFVQFGGGSPDWLVLDMGAAFQGTLTFYYNASSACYFAASMYPAFEIETAVLLGLAFPGTSSKAFTSPNDFRYVMAVCPDGGLDAVEVDSAPPAKWYATMPATYMSEVDLLVTGAPDGYSAPVGTSVFALNMGAPLRGQVTVYHTDTSPSCLVGPVDAAGTMSTILGATTAGASSSTFLATQDFQYIGVYCQIATPSFDLDAVEVMPVEITLEGYAVSVMHADDSVKNATAVLGAPDGGFATVPALSGDIYLDLGAQFSGLLTLTHATGNPACEVYGSSDILMQDVYLIGFMASGMTYTTLPIMTSTFPTGIRYVIIDCRPVEKGSLSLDAVSVQPAPQSTGNGLIVLAIGGKVQNQDAALGVQNEVYATIASPGGNILLYVGEPYYGEVTIYHSTTSPSCTIVASNGQDVGGPLGVTTAGTTSTTVDLPASYETVSVGVMCSNLAKKTSFQLDAVLATP